MYQCHGIDLLKMFPRNKIYDYNKHQKHFNTP